MPPEKRPEAPAPAMARPTMSMTEFLAAAQTMEPTRLCQCLDFSEFGRKSLTFEDHQRTQVSPLDIEIRVDLSKGWLQCCGCEQI